MTGSQTALFGIRDAAIAKTPPHIVDWPAFFKITPSLNKNVVWLGYDRAGRPDVANLIQV
jgi:hypothetical protein